MAAKITVAELAVELEQAIARIEALEQAVAGGGAVKDLSHLYAQDVIDAGLLPTNADTAAAPTIEN